MRVNVLVLGHTAELGGAEIGMVSMARYLPADVNMSIMCDLRVLLRHPAIWVAGGRRFVHAKAHTPAASPAPLSRRGAR